MRPQLGLSVLAALAVSLFAAAGAEAIPIGPSCDTCQGSIYDLTYLATPVATTATTETFRITYTIDTSGYTGPGEYLDAVALKIASSFVDATLVSAPNGVAAWKQVFGGLANAGCTGSGSGFDCVLVKSNADLLIVPGGTYTWVFDIEIETGALFTDPYEASVKARYVTVDVETGVRWKAGALVSEGITLSVPEPAGALLLLAAAGALRRARRR